MLEQTNEIMDVLGTPYGLPDDIDEDDLEAGVWLWRLANFCVRWFSCMEKLNILFGCFSFV